MHPKEKRYRAVVHYKYFLRSLRQVASKYGVSKSTLQRWIKQSETEMPKRKYKRRPKSYPEVVMERCKSLLTEDPFLTTYEIAKILSFECSWSKSRFTIARLLRHIKWSKKKAYRVASYNHKKEDIMAFANRYISACDDELVCIDESGFHAGDCGRRGYAPLGQRLNIQRRSNLRCQKYTLIMAVSNKRGIVGWNVLDHNCKKKDFMSFLTQKVLTVKLGKTTLLMDNIPFHRSREVQSMISDKDYEVLYTPPYSPRFNAIEMIFSILKQRYRRGCPVHPVHEFDYRQLIDDIIKSLTIDSCMCFFSHVKRAVKDIIDASDEIMIHGYDV